MRERRDIHLSAPRMWASLRIGAHLCGSRTSCLRGNNISATIRGGSLASGPNHRAGQHEWRPKPVRPIVEDDALLDHHIEELLRTFGDVIRMGELGPDTDERLESAPVRCRNSPVANRRQARRLHDDESRGCGLSERPFRCPQAGRATIRPIPVVSSKPLIESPNPRSSSAWDRLRAFVAWVPSEAPAASRAPVQPVPAHLS
jgi:hypothetical protein